MAESEFNSHFKKGYIDTVLTGLFENYNKYLADEKLEIFEENNTLIGCMKSINSCFIFNAKYYYYPGEVLENDPMIKVSLDPSLHIRMQEFLDNTAETDNEYRAISAYVRRLLNLANTVEDIFMLWPAILSEYLDDDLVAARAVSVMTQSLRSAIIEKFHKDTQSSLAYIKERKLKNLLIQ